MSGDATRNGIEGLLHRWHAARAAAGGLPAYEDMVLGNLGRMASRTALVGGPPGHPRLLWVGEAFEGWLARPGADLPLKDLALDDLPGGLAQSLREIVGDVLAGAEPVRAPCTRVAGGVAYTTGMLGLPLATRGAERLVLLCLAGATTRTNLLKTLFRSTRQGMVAAAAMRDGAGAVRDFRVLALNDAAAAMLRSTVETAQWQRLTTLLPHLRGSAALAHLVAAVEGQTGGYEASYPRPDGTTLHLRIEIAAIGDLLGVTLTDIGDLKAREASARLLFEHNPVPMWLAGEDGAVLAVNDAATAHYGFPREDFLSLSARDLAVAPEPGAAQRHRRRDGSLIDVEVFSGPIPFEGLSATLTACVDVTEQRRAERRIAHMAHHDALTGLPNRVLFHRRLAEAVATGRPVGLLCLDLDHFKLVNDTLGHPAGDALLRQVAERLRACLPADGLVARLGGDEFAVLSALPSPALIGLADAIVAALGRPFALPDHQDVTVGASIGIALAPEHGEDPDVLLRKADTALYAAKAGGRRTRRLFEPAMDAALQGRRALERDLREAIAAEALEVHYQPLVATGSLAVTGCEALLRWRHPERGFVSPATFIPVAEETGLIAAVGEWVLARACREAAGWPGGVRVAVNLSPAQFRTPDLVGTVARALAESGLHPARLELEITEQVMLEETTANLAVLHQLRALGVRIAIDDFGTGYASLSYLRVFPFDKIKIDRSFTAALGREATAVAIVQAVIGLGASLGMTTVAEGVETEAQLAALRRSGCGEVQGFLFSRPVPATELRRLLGEAAAPWTAAA
ncbi:putative bifunctional diguanylate cyclase/phosphodiesterase [Methylobacterium nonmethylotrophicum]|uniref:Bifunctional diguanylate cyclase/phosphodiesterase n=1 Tax=Methylobacterium nonmethylotrophicum TaxID=1141884 RepID=A0A4Z0NG96_9HYPH|nr:bifunctional diguanylate cyclase/phosphodiesterase [Methylobacterium nonmethylotrophicum]TGD94682.1 bifunctional diguanylate cyclase/phosphodiesterase [Methylobacterium nonmethylotrophicum]